MNLSKLEIDSEFSIPVLPAHDIIKLKYSRLLNLFGFATGIDSDIISFKKRPLGPEDKRYAAFNVMKEGTVSFNFDKNSLAIRWSVSLVNLYFLSALFAILSPTIVFILLKPHFWVLAIIGICTFGLSAGIGFLNISDKIEEVNISCLQEY
jgi:hypothetical protein